MRKKLYQIKQQIFKNKHTRDIDIEIREWNLMPKLKIPFHFKFQVNL